jgi:hypothetical protein
MVTRRLARRRTAMALVAALVSITFAGDGSDRAARAAGPLRHEGYLWQRAASEAVIDAARRAAAELDGTVVLAAEVAHANGERRVHLAPRDLPASGLAIRVGPVPAKERAAEGAALPVLARSVLAGRSVAELQLDYDAPTAALAEYAGWLAAVRAELEGEVALTITALPAWLDSPAFSRVLAQVDGYVLQVHSLEPPSNGEALVLCDAAAARRDVERAARFGKPFRVALPTYGYDVAYAANGRFLGLGAEQELPALPPGARLRRVEADAAAMAALVRGWRDDRPRELAGVVWFRVPVAGDRLAWGWPTLARVIRGEAPAAELAVEVRDAGDGLVQVMVHNKGSASARAAARVEATIARPIVTADAAGSYALAEMGAERVVFTAAEPPEVRAGEEVLVGWLRWEAPG